MRSLLTICLSCFILCTWAQDKIDYTLLHATFGLPHITVSAPQAASFEPITSAHMPVMPNTVIAPSAIIQSYTNRAEQQNQQLIQQSDAAISVQPNTNTLSATRGGIENDIDELVHLKPGGSNTIDNESYQQAFSQLMQLDPNNFSLEKAIYHIESAYFDNKLSNTNFLAGLHQVTEVVRQILKREGLSAKNSLAVNYAIQKLYQQDNPFYTARHELVALRQFKYDFDDYRGQHDYSKMFASKALATGRGQCHSLPLVYLLIAEQLGAKAYLALAPQHSFIRFKDANGNLRNFETTNGHIVSENWLIQSGYINAKALQNKTYLDTLSHPQLFAQMLGDLLLGYLAKYHRYDGFAEQVRQAILRINPENLTARIVGANLAVMDAQEAIKAVGMPKPNDLPQYPAAYRAYLTMKAALSQVDNLGYQDMPEEAYKKWLQSVAQAKQKQENDELKANMQREVEQMRKFQKQLQERIKQ